MRVSRLSPTHDPLPWEVPLPREVHLLDDGCWSPQGMHNTTTQHSTYKQNTRPTQAWVTKCATWECVDDARVYDGIGFTIFYYGEHSCSLMMVADGQQSPQGTPLSLHLLLYYLTCCLLVLLIALLIAHFCCCSRLLACCLLVLLIAHLEKIKQTNKLQRAFLALALLRVWVRQDSEGLSRPRLCGESFSCRAFRDYLEASETWSVVFAMSCALPITSREKQDTKTHSVCICAVHMAHGGRSEYTR